MWGAATEVIRRTRPRADADIGWEPVPIPLRSWPIDFAEDWQPLPIPIRVAR
jgi:hypothetical protein